jgi:protein gp37
MHPAWVRSLRDQCAAAGKLNLFFFKQNGEFAPFYFRDDGVPKRSFTFDDGTVVHKIGKKTAGRLLDGVEHNGMPV